MISLWLNKILMAVAIVLEAALNTLNVQMDSYFKEMGYGA
jgi:hypothetical protein